MHAGVRSAALSQGASFCRNAAPIEAQAKPPQKLPCTHAPAGLQSAARCTWLLLHATPWQRWRQPAKTKQRAWQRAGPWVKFQGQRPQLSAAALPQMRHPPRHVTQPTAAGPAPVAGLGQQSRQWLEAVKLVLHRQLRPRRSNRNSWRWRGSARSQAGSVTDLPSAGVTLRGLNCAA